MVGIADRTFVVLATKRPRAPARPDHGRVRGHAVGEVRAVGVRAESVEMVGRAPARQAAWEVERVKIAKRIAGVRDAPMVEANPQLEGGVTGSDDLGFVDAELLQQVRHRRHGRLADADARDLR